MRRCCLLVVLLLTALRAASQEPVRVFLIGDSTCAAKKTDKENPERGWGQLFVPLFDEGVFVENHAANGRSTKSFRDEGRWDTVCDRLRAGDYVFIQFGHNDEKVADTTRYSPPEVYAENLRRYIRETKQEGAVPVLLTPIVRRHFIDGVLTPTHGAYPDAMRRVAAEEGVTLIDMQPATRDWVMSLGDSASKACYMWVAPGTCPLYPDGRQDDTHLNVGGARTVARMVADSVRSRLPGLGAHLTAYDFVVAKDGSGDFFTLGEAVAAIPDFARDTVRVLVCEGVYREKVVIPATKRLVALDGRGSVCVMWDDYASKNSATGRPLGTSGSATVYFGGEGWTVRNIAFENAAGRVGQAVAVQCLADRLHFVGCRFLGDQDTLYLYGSGNREGDTVPVNAFMLFDDCYIEGTTDFIFGAASALFRRCEIRSKADSYITAASTCRGQMCGVIFDRCRLTAAEGVTSCYLGRPWREHAQTVFIGCYLGAHIRPEGWHDWNKPQAHETVFYAECASEGPGSAPGKRVGWSRQLTPQAAKKLIETFLNGSNFR